MFSSPIQAFLYMVRLTYRDLSNNNLSGEVPSTGSFSLFTPIRYLPCYFLKLLGSSSLQDDIYCLPCVSLCSFANNPLLCGPGTTKPCPGAPPFSPPPPYSPPVLVQSPGIVTRLMFNFFLLRVCIKHRLECNNDNTHYRNRPTSLG